MSNYETQDLTRFLAGKIRALMAQHNVSQGQLAEAIGVSQSQLSKMVRGARPITIDQFEAMCWSFGVNFHELLEEAHDFLINYDNPIPTKLVFVEEGVRLPAPIRIDNSDTAPVISVHEGRKRGNNTLAPVIVGGFGNNAVTEEEIPENVEEAWAGQYAAHPKGELPEDHTP